MGDAGDGENLADEAPAPRVRRRPRWLAGSAVALAVALGVAWSTREPIVDYLVAGELARLGLPAKYRIESIAPGRQVLRDVAIGDPARPDLLVPRIVVTTGVRGGLPAITGLRLEHPRLAARLHGGRLSLGALDALARGPSTGRLRLPDLALTVVDGRVTLQTDSGRAAAVLTGSGPLRDGFAGTLGLSWPGAAFGACHAGKAVFAGTVRVADERPGLDGPLRLGRLDCAGATLAVARIAIAASLAPALDGGEGDLTIDAASFATGSTRIARTEGKARVAVGGGTVTARYDLALAGLASPAAMAARIGIEGVLHGGGPAGLRAEGKLTGSRVAPGPATVGTLAAATRAAAETPAEALLAQFTRALDREAAGSRFEAGYQLRRQGQSLGLVLPNARLSAAGGETLLTLSRFGLGSDGSGRWRVAGALRTGGRGLPAIAGQWNSDETGTLRARLAMADYRSGESRLAIPALAMTVRPDGRVGFAGGVTTSGPLPGGGATRDLQVPIVGDWSARGGLAIWHRCLPVRFASLRLSSLTLRQRGLILCPAHGQPLLAVTPDGTRAAAGVHTLDLAGTLGGSPITIAGGPLGFAWPGRLVAGKLAVTLGSGDQASRFALSGLSAALGTGRDGAIAGTLTGGDVRLAAVPLDVTAISGPWRYAGGRLELTGTAFRVSDRDAKTPRFNPLAARDAGLTLVGGRITAHADLREPLSDRLVTHLDLSNDLASANGTARLSVPSLTFDKAVQPDTLTPLALGVVANVAGSVRGSGAIDWNSSKVTSTGRFTTDSLDLAAAFGPARGISGTVEFTDLLGLVTAPRQTLKIASINPGIEADDGVLVFALTGGANHVLAIEGAHWPFLDGRLELLPTRMTLGIAETRRYVLKVTGISAARFIERMDISNLAATGSFDGQLPLRFDQNGGWIEGGGLASRPPGGSVSYVGELSYKDLSPMANFAFQTLRALDYRRMTIGMDGPLAGELVTRVSMSGVTQGKGAKKNFVTRQLASLPIRFDVNIRAPFFQLVSSFKSFYDPNYLADPRALGLIDAFGRPVAQPSTSKPAPAAPIQPPASEHRP
jgi:hypothetical protein